MSALQCLEACKLDLLLFFSSYLMYKDNHPRLLLICLNCIIIACFIIVNHITRSIQLLYNRPQDIMCLNEEYQYIHWFVLPWLQEQLDATQKQQQ